MVSASARELQHYAGMAVCAGEASGRLRPSGLRARAPYDSSPEEPGAPPGICVGFVHSPGATWSLLLVQCQQPLLGERWLLVTSGTAPAPRGCRPPSQALSSCSLPVRGFRLCRRLPRGPWVSLDLVAAAFCLSCAPAPPSPCGLGPQPRGADGGDPEAAHGAGLPPGVQWRAQPGPRAPEEHPGQGGPEEAAQVCQLRPAPGRQGRGSQVSPGPSVAAPAPCPLARAVPRSCRSLRLSQRTPQPHSLTSRPCQPRGQPGGWAASPGLCCVTSHLGTRKWGARARGALPGQEADDRVAGCGQPFSALTRQLLTRRAVPNVPKNLYEGSSLSPASSPPLIPQPQMFATYHLVSECCRLRSRDTTSIPTRPRKWGQAGGSRAAGPSMGPDGAHKIQQQRQERAAGMAVPGGARPGPALLPTCFVASVQPQSEAGRPLASWF